METTSRKDWGDLIKDWLDQIKYCFYYLTWLTHMHKWTRAHTCIRALHTHTHAIHVHTETQTNTHKHITLWDWFSRCEQGGNPFMEMIFDMSLSSLNGNLDSTVVNIASQLTGLLR